MARFIFSSSLVFCIGIVLTQGIPLESPAPAEHDLNAITSIFDNILDVYGMDTNNNIRGNIITVVKELRVMAKDLWDLNIKEKSQMLKEMAKKHFQNTTDLPTIINGIKQCLKSYEMYVTEEKKHLLKHLLNEPNKNIESKKQHKRLYGLELALLRISIGKLTLNNIEKILLQ